MRIGELAKRTNVAPSRIRFYERKGILPTAHRLRSGYRDYPEHIVELLKLVLIAQHLGFTLAEIKRFLPEDLTNYSNQDDTIMQLQNKLQAVEQHMVELKKLKCKITKMISFLAHRADADQCATISELHDLIVSEER